MSPRIKLTRHRRGVRPFVLRWSVSAVAICAACSAEAPDDGASQDPIVEQDLAQVVYQGEVTDEALLRLLDSVAQPESQPHVSMCSVESGTSLPAATPIEFSFSMSTCALAPDLSGERLGQAMPQAEPILSRLLGVFAPIGVAHAHGAPFNGTAYYLRVVDADGAVSMQAFTDATTYKPNQAQWTRMVESPGPLRLEIVWAEFDNNEVAGNGPFEATPVSFQLQR